MSGDSRTARAATLRAFGLVLLTMFLFAVYDGISKHLGRRYPVPEMLWVRYLTHVGLMLCLYAPGMGLRLVRTSRPLLQLVRAGLLLMVTFLMTTALLYLPLAETTAINFLAPLVATLLSIPLLRERVAAREWVAVAAGFVGVLLIVRPGGSLMTPATLLPLGSALCYGLYQVLTRQVSAHEHPVTTHFIMGLAGLTVTSLLWQPGWLMPTLLDGGLMVVLGVISAAGHYLLIVALTQAGPAAVAPFSYTQIVWACVLGFLVFGEHPDGPAFVGIAVIVASGLYVGYQHARPPPAKGPH